MATAETGRSILKARVKQFEYEIIILIFLLLRFVFKNILGFATYFTKQPIFGFNDKLSILIGTAVLFIICTFLAMIFGKLIRSNGAEYEKPILFFVAFFFACPASLPFLFNTDSLTGTQMFYPFALFILSIFLISKPFVKWLVPLICAVYFVPAVFTNEIFFSVLRKGAILYVPLILLFLFLEMMKIQIEPGSKQKKTINMKSASSILFFVSLLISIASYIYTLTRGKSYYEDFYNNIQRLNGYFVVCLLIVTPALAAIGAVLYYAVKNKFSMPVFDIFWRAPIVLFILYRSNFYGLWIPFLIISLFLVVFFSIQKKNPAMLSAVRTVGDYLSAHLFLFYITLIAMASLSNVTSAYLSTLFQKIFEIVPY